MSRPEFDAVIAGGGLSGLSLAAHLAAGGWRERSVLVVDDGVIGSGATSWGSWSAAPGLLEGAVSRTYRRVRIHAAGTARVISLGGYRYQVVRRDDLRRIVSAMLRACPRFCVVQAHIDDVRDCLDTAEAVVGGERVRAAWVFDSVTGRPDGSDVDARLAFTGYEVHSVVPLFDPQTPVLFDFGTPQADGARFVYVLPTDTHRALVELTEFVPRHAPPPSEAARRAALDAYLRDVLHSDDHEILRSESAVLALRTHPGPRRHGRVLAIGARGGLVKASTGYAYQRIQRDSAAIAASLVIHGHPWNIPQPRPRHRVLDAMLLDVLDRDPPRLEQAFALLFAHHPAERILRFLDEDTGIRDELRIILSLPPVPYLRALARYAAHPHR